MLHRRKIISKVNSFKTALNTQL